MRQRDPHWLQRIVEDAARTVESTPLWLRNAEVQTELRRIKEGKQAEGVASRKREDRAE